MAVDLINEFDLVGRADRPYILSLVNLLRHRHGHPPLQPDAKNVAVHDDPTPDGEGNSKPCFREDAREIQGAAWPAPEMLYRHVGSPIILMMRLDENDSMRLKAVEAPSHLLGDLLFCRLSVHKKSCYAERVKLLERLETC